MPEKRVQIAVPSSKSEESKGSHHDDAAATGRSSRSSDAKGAPRGLRETRSFGLGSFRYENETRTKMLWSMLRISPSRITGKGRRAWIGLYTFLEFAAFGVFVYTFLGLYTRTSNMKSTYCAAPFIYTSDSQAACVSGTYDCILGADPVVVAALLETYPRLCMPDLSCPDGFDQSTLSSEDLSTCLPNPTGEENVVLCSNLDALDSVKFPWCGDHSVVYTVASSSAAIQSSLNLTQPDLYNGTTTGSDWFFHNYCDYGSIASEWRNDNNVILELYANDMCGLITSMTAKAESLGYIASSAQRRRLQTQPDIPLPEVVAPYVSAGNGECIPYLWSYTVLKNLQIPFIAAFGVAFITWLVKLYYLYRTQTKNVIWRVSGHMCILLLSTLCRFVSDTVFGVYVVLVLIAVYGDSGTRCSSCFMNRGTSSACVASYSPVQLLDIRNEETWVLIAIVVMQLLLAAWWQYYICKVPRLPPTPRTALKSVDAPEHNYDPRVKHGLRGPMSASVLMASRAGDTKASGKVTKDMLLNETDAMLASMDQRFTPRQEKVAALKRFRDARGNDLPFSLALVRHKMSGPASMGKYSKVSLPTASPSTQILAQKASQLRAGRWAAPGASTRAHAATRLPGQSAAAAVERALRSNVSAHAGGGTLSRVGLAGLHAAGDAAIDTGDGMVIEVQPQRAQAASEENRQQFTSRGLLLTVDAPDVGHDVHDSPVKSRVLEYEKTQGGQGAGSAPADDKKEGNEGGDPVLVADESIPHYSVQVQPGKSREVKRKQKRVANKVGITVAGPRGVLHPNAVETSQRRHVWLRHDEGEPPLLPPHVRGILAQKARFAHTIVGPDVVGTGYGGDADWTETTNQLRETVGKKPLPRKTIHQEERAKEKAEAEKYGLESISSEGRDSLDFLMEEPQGAPLVYEAPPVPGGDNKQLPHPHYGWELSVAERMRLEKQQGTRCCRSLRVNRCMCCSCCMCSFLASFSLFMYPVIVAAFVLFKANGLMRVEDADSTEAYMLELFILGGICLLGIGALAWVAAVVTGLYYWCYKQP